jgi:hypothetical protein
MIPFLLVEDLWVEPWVEFVGEEVDPLLVVVQACER